MFHDDDVEFRGFPMCHLRNICVVCRIVLINDQIQGVVVCVSRFELFIPVSISSKKGSFQAINTRHQKNLFPLLFDDAWRRRRRQT